MLSLFKKFRFAGIVAIVAVFAAGCTGVRGTSWAGVTLLDDSQQILVAFNDRMVLVDPTEGEPVPLRNAEGEVRLDDRGNPRVWEVDGDGESRAQFFSAPVLTDPETLLVATYEGQILEIDVESARVNGPATQIEGRVVADLVTGEEVVFVGLAQQDLIALSSEDLSPRWSVTTHHGVWAEPLLLDGVVYFTSLDHFLYAVDVASGEQLWALDLEGAASSTPTYHDGHLYVGSFAKKVFQVSLDGEVTSEYETNNWVWSAPTLVDETLYVSDLGGHVYALDISDGDFAEIWAVQPTTAAIRPAPLVADETVVVAGRDNNVYWLSQETGATIFEREVRGEILADMLLIEPDAERNIDEPLVVVSTMANNEILVAFTLETGERVWTYGR